MKSSRNLIKKAVCILFVGFSVLFFSIALLAASRLGFGDGFSNWIIVTFPLVSSAVCAILSLVLCLIPEDVHQRTSGLLWGAFVGANGFLILPAFSLFTRFSLISQDGTAYWGLLSLPCLFVGLPAFLTGSLVGLIAGFVSSKRETGSD